MGSIQENMTLTPRTPTFICMDREGQSFAVTVKLPVGEEGMDVRGWKKGFVGTCCSDSCVVKSDD